MSLVFSHSLGGCVVSGEGRLTRWRSFPFHRSLTDVFGLWNNSKILSDKIADGTGYRVFVPDVLEGINNPARRPPFTLHSDSSPLCSGDPLKAEDIYMNMQPIGNMPILTRIREMAKSIIPFFRGYGVWWLLKHTIERVGGIAQKVSPGNRFWHDKLGRCGDVGVRSDSSSLP